MPGEGRRRAEGRKKDEGEKREAVSFPRGMGWWHAPIFHPLLTAGCYVTVFFLLHYPSYSLNTVSVFSYPQLSLSMVQTQPASLSLNPRIGRMNVKLKGASLAKVNKRCI